MHNGVSETLCTACAHLPVCKLKETYLKAQEAVNNASFHDEVVEDEGTSKHVITYVANVRDWLSVPRLECKYFTKTEVITRR